MRICPAAALLSALASAAILLGTAALPAQPSDPLRPLLPKKTATGAGLSKGEFTVAIEGVKQGRFKGEGTSDNLKDKLIGLTFDSEIKLPRDASGNATGKRQHMPLTFTKDWGAASPQLFQAAATGETLKSVEFSFYTSATGSSPEAFYTIKLTSATITSLHQKSIDGRLVEEVSLAFAKIEVEHKPSKTAASDETGK